MDTINTGKKQSILNYFKRKASTSPSQNSESGKTNKVLVTSCPVTNNENLDEKNKDCDIETNCTINSNIQLLPQINDIALFINRSLNDEEKLLVLRNVWKPPKMYKYPLLEQNKKRGLIFQSKWFDEFSWLVYSEIKKGAFCKFCAIFSKTGGALNQPLGQLVLVEYTNWKKAKKVFQNHCKLEYHINATLDAEHFINVLEKKEKSIIEQLDSDRIVQVKKNRKRLVPIIECILLCGRQELALRGHRGEKRNILIDENAIQNAGNFRAILQFRAKGDIFLQNVLEGTDTINEAQCFSVLADETTDISTSEQLTLCVRYIDSEGNLNEDFLKFIIVESLTGSDLSAAILNGLVECGLDCAFLIGQGYDGASNMSGKVQGVKSYIQTKYPKAIYVHCAAHSLNLAVSTASDLKPIRNCLGIIEKVYTFLNTPKRSAVMFHVIDNENADLNIKKLKRLCATRWIQRYDAVNDFCELLPYVMISLDKISEWRDSSGADASILKKAIDSEFLISLFVIKKLFSFGLPLCRQLQLKRIDLKDAVQLAEDTITSLKNIRENIEQEFQIIYNSVKEMANIIDVEIKAKRITNKQKHRANYKTENDENMELVDFFRISIFIPYIDNFISQLELRFVDHKKIFEGFECLFSNQSSKEELESFNNLLEFYTPLIDSNNSTAELMLWKVKLSRLNIVPKTSLEAFLLCDAKIFPNINKLLKILCTLPVSTATPERTFSTLKRVKTYLRNTTGQNRLNGLCMLSVHKNINVTPDEVLNILSLSSRKLDFVL
ncbi:unnamed protein product [Macrosiphum euphorbiae]|uniref:TTF-type domain-containing protein n=1 Tax=Macrosiphum euphorbiae TaxID=13131 RepID=A0AAV0XP36_9HEMI|nr:unnamed protein product [Macrosiphum euphorbiae]